EAIVIVLVPHQDFAHPLGHQHQDNTADKTVKGIKPPEVFPGVVNMAVDNNIENQQQSTAGVESVKNFLDVFRLIKEMVFFSIHDISLQPLRPVHTAVEERQTTVRTSGR